MLALREPEFLPAPGDDDTGESQDATHRPAAFEPVHDLEGVGGVDPDTPPFSPLELLVIGVGERDQLTLVTNSWWAQARRLLFGVEAPRPFLDRRLEALRLLTLALRRRRSHDAALAAALAAGVSPSSN